MRTFFVLLMSVLLSLSLIATDASAKRFGGGRSFGMSRNMNSFAKPNSAFSSSASKVNNIAANKNRWLGPLAGLAIGTILGSLLMGHGFSSAILSWILVAFAAVMIMRLVRGLMEKKATSGNQAYYSQQQAYEPASAYQPSAFSAPSQPAIAADVDADTFLRDARVAFYRLQAAYDQKDLSDLRQFTTPEVYAEIQMQLQERGDAENQTLVMSLDANILEAESLVASVQFSGKIKENSDAANFFEEIWHFSRHDVDSRWIVAGLEQTKVN